MSSALFYPQRHKLSVYLQNICTVLIMDSEKKKKARVYHQDASDAAPFRPTALGGFSGACIPSGNIVFASAASGDKEPTHHRELLARTAVKMITSTCKRNNSNNSLLRFLLPFFRRLESLGSKAIYKAL